MVSTFGTNITSSYSTLLPMPVVMPFYEQIPQQMSWLPSEPWREVTCTINSGSMSTTFQVVSFPLIAWNTSDWRQCQWASTRGQLGVSGLP